MNRHVLLYVQHLLGVGHVKRAAAIARGLQEFDVPVTIAFGGCPVPGIEFSDARVSQLPAIQSADATFSSLVDSNGAPVSEAMWAEREQQLLELYERVQPGLILTEHFPFGRRKFRRELIPLFHRARKSPDTRIVASVRDILIAPTDVAKSDKMIAMAREWFNAILVHSDPDVIRLEDTFPAATEISALLRYTGYIVNDEYPTMVASPDDGHDEVIISAGGGAVGETLFRTAFEARAGGCLADKTWRFLAGSNLSNDVVSELQTRAVADVIIEPVRPDFPVLLKRAAVSVSQAGYNTIMDLLVARCPAVVVPFATGGETEQTMRAEKFATANVLTHLSESELTPARLTEAIHTALSQRHDSGTLVGNINGKSETGRLLAEMLA